jgi:hypothetical protein
MEKSRIDEMSGRVEELIQGMITDLVLVMVD